jgi:hypothetical protein
MLYLLDLELRSIFVFMEMGRLPHLRLGFHSLKVQALCPRQPRPPSIHSGGFPKDRAAEPGHPRSGSSPSVAPFIQLTITKPSREAQALVEQSSIRR